MSMTNEVIHEWFDLIEEDIGSAETLGLEFADPLIATSHCALREQHMRDSE
jgi:hypothetical protein